MKFLSYFSAVVILVLINVRLNVCRSDFRRQLKQYMEACSKLARRPNLNEEGLIGKRWRVYYTWNLQWQEKCIDITFKTATNTIIRRVWHDMNEYMKEQPEWDAASVLMTIGTKQNGREVLMFPGRGPIGEYRAVTNMMFEGSNIIPQKKDVPIEKYQLKTFHGDNFLVLMDCMVGVAVLAARPDRMPYRLEIAAVADSLRLANGQVACLHDKNRRLDEEFIQIEYNDTSGLN